MICYRILTNALRFNVLQTTSRSICSVQNLLKSTILSSPLPYQLPLINSTFLKPVNFILNQAAGFKVKGRLRRRCKDCYFVMREERLYCLCKTHQRHKQMAMKKKPKNTWILTHATQSKIRPY